MKSDPAREARLAAALKANLKRRKARKRLESGGELRELGTAPQAGLEDAPQPGPKSAPKQR